MKYLIQLPHYNSHGPAWVNQTNVIDNILSQRDITYSSVCSNKKRLNRNHRSHLITCRYVYKKYKYTNISKIVIGI